MSIGRWMSSSSTTPVASLMATELERSLWGICLNWHLPLFLNQKETLMKATINRCASFVKKNGVYAFYVNFGFIFLRGKAVRLMDDLLASADSEGLLNLGVVPESFAQYLDAKKILA